MPQVVNMNQKHQSGDTGRFQHSKKTSKPAMLGGRWCTFYCTFCIQNVCVSACIAHQSPGQTPTYRGETFLACPLGATRDTNGVSKPSFPLGMPQMDVWCLLLGIAGGPHRCNLFREIHLKYNKKMVSRHENASFRVITCLRW